MTDSRPPTRGVVAQSFRCSSSSTYWRQCIATSFTFEDHPSSIGFTPGPPHGRVAGQSKCKFDNWTSPRWVGYVLFSSFDASGGGLLISKRLTPHTFVNARRLSSRRYSPYFVFFFFCCKHVVMQLSTWSQITDSGKPSRGAGTVQLGKSLSGFS